MPRKSTLLLTTLLLLVFSNKTKSYPIITSCRDGDYFNCNFNREIFYTSQPYVPQQNTSSASVLIISSDSTSRNGDKKQDEEFGIFMCWSLGLIFIIPLGMFFRLFSDFLEAFKNRYEQIDLLAAPDDSKCSIFVKKFLRFEFLFLAISFISALP